MHEEQIYKNTQFDNKVSCNLKVKKTIFGGNDVKYPGIYLQG